MLDSNPWSLKCVVIIKANNWNSSTYGRKIVTRKKEKTRKPVSLSSRVIKTPLKLYKVNIIEIARGHGVTVSDEIGSHLDFLLNADLFMEYWMGKAAWRKIQITKASRIFPRENNKASKGSSNSIETHFFQRFLSPFSFRIGKKKIFKALASFFPFVSSFKQRLDSFHHIGFLVIAFLLEENYCAQKIRIKEAVTITILSPTTFTNHD